MVTKNLGRIGFVNKGNWVDGLHKANDVVEYDNSIYVCIVEHTSTSGNILPTDTNYWVNWIDGNKWYLRTKLDTANIFRADKYLASQNISKLLYNANGDLVKIQYNNPTDVDYELFTYTTGDLTGIAHYVGSVLKGNSVLSYTNGDLTSVVFTGV